MYVVPEHRKKGYFRELYAYVKKEALASKACGLRLYADNGNTRAHMAVGFTIANVTRLQKLHLQHNLVVVLTIVCFTGCDNNKSSLVW